MQKWKRISSKVLYSHPRMTLTEDHVELPNGEVVPYLRTGGNKAAAVTVIAIQDDKILLQQEYSYPPDKILYQFPGGAVEKGEELATAESLQHIVVPDTPVVYLCVLNTPTRQTCVCGPFYL